MARLYANENFPLAGVLELRQLGHDCLTSIDAGNANQGMPDQQVLAFAGSDRRAVLTLNRLHFIRLHQQAANHSGIIVCTFDPDFVGQREPFIRNRSSSESNKCRRFIVSPIG